MRIITGSAKGTKLKAPCGSQTRPTADRVKESVFNILGRIVEDAKVLDLFGGTGNLGLETLSRGAESAVFIDKSPSSVNLIKENSIITKLESRTEVFKTDSLKALDRFIQGGRQFDLIFCDPPYNKGLVQLVLKKIDSSQILTSNGMIIVEHSKHEPIHTEFAQLVVKRTEKYGETLVTFVTHSKQEV